MLVFGPYSIIPKHVDFTVFNLSSLTQVVPRLPGLMVDLRNLDIYSSEQEKSFDIWYYDYVMNDITACTSLMQILNALYDNGNVYVCIADYSTDPYMSIINESFMKLIQTRYDIKYSIINTEEDFDYIPHDGCDFMSVEGINNFDEDRHRYELLMMESKIAGKPL